MTCFFPVSFILVSPQSIACLSRERRSFTFKKSSLDFQSYFYKLKKAHRQPAYSENSKSKNTNRSSLGVGDPGRLDIQPVAGRKEGVKQQLPKAE